MKNVILSLVSYSKKFMKSIKKNILLNYYYQFNKNILLLKITNFTIKINKIKY